MSSDGERKCVCVCVCVCLCVGACRSQWPRGLKSRSAAARQLRLWVRILPGAWMFASCVCCVLSGRGLCVGLVTRAEKSYRLWCVVVCNLEISSMGRPWLALGHKVQEKYIYLYRSLQATVTQSKNGPFGVNSNNNVY